MRKSGFRCDIDKLVYIERHGQKAGKNYHRRMWVAGDNVRPDDIVLLNEHNVRPYKYDPENMISEPEQTKKQAENTHISRIGSAHNRRLCALFSEVMKSEATSAEHLCKKGDQADEHIG